MEMTRLEAIDIFRGWLSEGAWLRCVFEFSRFTAFLRGRVVEVSEESIRILSDDTFSELALGLDSLHDHARGENLVAHMQDGPATVFPFPFACQ